MISKKLKQIISLFSSTEKNHALRYSGHVRREAEQNIADMIADLNGCSDRWFLSPKAPLDECIKRDEDLF